MCKEQLIDDYITKHVFDSWVPSPLTCKRDGKEYGVYVIPTVLLNRIIHMFNLTINECELQISKWLKKHLKLSDAIVVSFYGKPLTRPDL